MNTRFFRFALPVAALAVTLSACAGTSATTGTAETGSNHPAGSSTGKAAPAADSKPADDGTAKFGSTYKFDDGLSVTISAPAKYAPSDTAMAPKTKAFRVWSVTVVNKTGKVYDPTTFYTSLQSGNEEMEQIFDSAKAVGGAPDTKLLNGREAKFKIAFGASNPSDLVMEVRPGFEYDSVMFTS